MQQDRSGLVAPLTGLTIHLPNGSGLSDTGFPTCSSITALTLNVGASREESGVVFNSVTVPSTCPSGKFAWAGDATFNGEASEPIGATETACPAAGSRQATTTSLSASNATPLRGEPVTYTATVTPNSSGGPVLSGGVTFFDGSTAIADCSARPLTQDGVSAAATCQANYAAYGTHTISATYGGDANYLGSSSGTENVVLSAGTEETRKTHEEEVANKRPTTITTTGSSTPSGPGNSTQVATISSTQIAALLGRQLVPTGKSARITTLLKDGGLTMSFTALEAGTLSVQWYDLPNGTKLAENAKAKPVLVASGRASFTGAATEKVKVRLTAAGKKLLKAAKRAKLEARGMFMPLEKAPVSQAERFALQH
jgi:Bacterial Ig-like domain (group 3)